MTIPNAQERDLAMRHIFYLIDGNKQDWIDSGEGAVDKDVLDMAQALSEHRKRSEIAERTLIATYLREMGAKEKNSDVQAALAAYADDVHLLYYKVDGYSSKPIPAEYREVCEAAHKEVAARVSSPVTSDVD